MAEWTGSAAIFPDNGGSEPWRRADLSTGAGLAAALRSAARGALPESAFLRRDRGDGLFVTDAPRRCPDFDWASSLARAGFEGRPLPGGLLALRPGPAWLAALAAEHPEPPDFLCASLKRFDRPAEPESLALFAGIAKALEADDGLAVCEKALRQRAAVCLRTGGGNGLYACALAARLADRES